MSQSFVMLKPESALYINEILEELQKEKFSIGKPYLIENYKSFAQAIYYIANYVKDPRYYEIIKACIEAETILFGNMAMLLSVSNEEDLIQHLIHLDQIKSRIRKVISLSKSKCLQAFIDVDKLDVDCSSATYGDIQILLDGCPQETYKANTATGNFVCFYLSYMHTIDPEYGIYQKTIELIQNSHRLRPLSKSEFQITQKYKTYHL